MRFKVFRIIVGARCHIPFSFLGLNSRHGAFTVVVNNDMAGYLCEDGNATHEQILPNDSTHSTPASSISLGEIHWSAVITMKKLKCISSTVGDDKPNDDNGALELTMSSSLPSFAKGDETIRLVRKHSRLSVSSKNDEVISI
jgi:hypothetical protein